MFWKWPLLDPFFCAAPWLSIHQFRLWTRAYTCTCLRLQKTRKAALQLLNTQTSEDILGMTLPHDNLFTRRDGKVPQREHISFLDLSTLVRWLWWSYCHLQRVETHIKKSLHIVSVHSTWTLVSAHKGTQNQAGRNNILLFFFIFLFYFILFFKKAGWWSQAAFGGPSKSMLIPQLNQPRAPPVVMCPPFRDAQTHPMKVTMTVDTVILATQEKESLLFQPWNYSGGSRDHKQRFPCSDPHANFNPLPFSEHCWWAAPLHLNDCH